MYLLGIDLGSSSVKVALVGSDSGAVIGSCQYPESEYGIVSKQAGWAEQDPEMWWESTCQAIKKLLLESGIKASEIQAVGIAYQMHGLVLVDRNQKVLRPSIIWCDSRAVEIGHNAFQGIGEDYCLNNLLNSPGNFTASKLAWVKENQPELFSRIDKFMLPGDYIAMRLTGGIRTSISGLSEGIFWDFKRDAVSDEILSYFNFDSASLADYGSCLGPSSSVSDKGAREAGLVSGIPVSYRAGDQPNNALSLAVMEPGQIAATGGTSGVVYGIAESIQCDPDSGFNAFAHVNHSSNTPRIGCLMCINGAGSAYAWIKRNLADKAMRYTDMEAMLQSAEPGSGNLKVLPFGNGAERILGNKDNGAVISGLQFNRHGNAEVFRATLEGIAYSFCYGIDKMKKAGLDINDINAGHSNLFLSDTFVKVLASLTECRINLYNSNGAVGAAFGAGLGIGLPIDLSESVKLKSSVEPGYEKEFYRQDYKDWLKQLNHYLSN